jgi:hypothetical protein
MGLFSFAKKVVKNPIYSVATSLVPGLDISNSITQAIDPLLGLTPGGTGSDILNTILRAGGGYLQGGNTGAAVGALGGLVNNYQPISDWVSNLSNSGALGNLAEGLISGGVKATGNAANPLIGAGMGGLQYLFPSIPGGYTVGQTSTGGTIKGPINAGTTGTLGQPVTPPASTVDPAAAAAAGGGAASTGTTPTPTSTSGLSGLLAAIQALPGGAQLGLGAGALGLLGSLLGGSSSSSSGAKYDPPPLFGGSSTGPGYNYANYGGAGYAPRQAVTPAIADYYTYGTRPEATFYQNLAPPVTTAPGMKRGGGLGKVARYIKGAGSGRSDTVAIKGSPGEYMMDAETVSMLGDGNNEAGARKLDQMRKKVRKHKGKALARGSFSPNAKSPESYMGA